MERDVLKEEKYKREIFTSHFPKSLIAIAIR
jgi:hypothetical protein